MAFPTRSTSTTQTNEAWEVKEEMEINSQRAASEVGIGAKEALGNQPLSKNQIDSNVWEKSVEIREVSMERVQDSPLRSQLKGVPN
jgi:hypothetical protein